MLEKEYQKGLIPRIHNRIPDCTILVNDPLVQQGILDLAVIANNKRGFLEVKASAKSPKRPNQQYYVDNPDKLGGVFAAFIYPENEEEVLSALQQALHP